MSVVVVAYLPLLVSLLGLVIYLWADPAKSTKASTVGRLMFFAGLLAFLIVVAPQYVVKIGK